jgi:uncharacterized membrane protein
MNCVEFLEVLREALEGKVPEQVIQDNLNYYRSYINGEVLKGKSEADVIESIGDPRLIARTIEESTKYASDNNAQYDEYGNADYEDSTDGMGNRIRQINIPGWLAAVIAIAIMLLLIIVVFRVAVFAAPFIIAFVLAGIIYRAVKSWID